MHSVTLYHWEPHANSGKPMLALMEKGAAFNSHRPRRSNKARSRGGDRAGEAERPENAGLKGAA